jgi:hypothetical protein
MGAHGQAVLDGHGVAQIHGGVDVGEALALGDAGQQRLDGAEELVGVDAQRCKGGAIGEDVLRLLGLFPGEIRLAGGNVFRQHLFQLGDIVGVVQPSHGHRAEAGVGQLVKEFLGYLIVHGVASLLWILPAMLACWVHYRPVFAVCQGKIFRGIKKQSVHYRILRSYKDTLHVSLRQKRCRMGKCRRIRTGALYVSVHFLRF